MNIVWNDNNLKVVSVSGGKDSTALYCLMVEYFGHDFFPIFADTGNEHPVTINYIRNLHEMAGGPKVTIVKADFRRELRDKRRRLARQLSELYVDGKGELHEYKDLLKKARSLAPTGIPFLDMALWKGRFPSTKAQFCTEWLKLYPIYCFLMDYSPSMQWEMFTGIRAGESFNRSKRLPFAWNNYFSCPETLPLLYESEEWVYSFLEGKGVPPNPLYVLGYNRVGCFPCIHCNKGQLSLLPDWAWDKLEWWEGRMGRTWFPPGVVPGLEGLTTIGAIREWCKTSWGGKQYDLFKSADIEDAPACMSTWGHCE